MAMRMATLATIMAIIMAINGNANGHKLQNDNGHKCPIIMANYGNNNAMIMAILAMLMAIMAMIMAI